jgi:peptidyl-prolyl cis-trans isomerase SDCCAG10
MMQTGDPTGTGKGGESVWGRPFKDEFHGRVRFNHRGQVAMANENSPHTNRSQFFITLGACSWLDKKHTIFGKVTGNTIYNVMRLNDTEVDEGRDFAPLDTSMLKIKTIEVLWNPFDDIVPRDLGQSRAPVESHQEKRTDKGKSVKDKKLLSFDDDEEEEEEGLPSFGTKKMHSCHSSSLKPTSSRLSAQPAYDEAVIATTAGSQSRGNRGSLASHDRDEASHNPPAVVRCASAVAAPASSASLSRAQDRWDRPNSEDEGEDAPPSPSPSTKPPAAPAAVTTEFDELRAQLMNSRRAVKVALSDPMGTAADAAQELSSEVEKRRQKYLKRKKVHGDRATDTMAKLMAFKSNISQKKVKVTSETDGVGSDGGDDLGDWASGKLKFVHHPDDSYRNT